MKVVLGLGNPGRRYEGTRHNVGFEVVGRLAARGGGRIAERGFQSLLGSVTVGAEKVLLVAPQTFMNLSGEAAREVAGFYKIAPADLLVVLDDTALDVGRIRFRADGSSGGHNGLESVLSCLGTDAVPRLRVGVGRGDEARQDLTDHVLGRFGPEEGAVIGKTLDVAAEAVETWVSEGIAACMNRYNARPKGGAQGGEEGPESGTPGGPRDGGDR